MLKSVDLAQWSGRAGDEISGPDMHAFNGNETSDSTVHAFKSDGSGIAACFEGADIDRINDTHSITANTAAATTGFAAIDALERMRLQVLMLRGQGSPELSIGLIDGPVALHHRDLAQSRIKPIPEAGGSCERLASVACTHGTFIAGMLVARRGSQAPAICPGCTLLLRPIFTENDSGDTEMPTASASELAVALGDAIAAGAKVINLSAALLHASPRGARELQQALNHAAQRGVLVVAAAGNEGTIGSSIITGHPWVIPVTACDSAGRPTSQSNLGSSIGRRGLAAPAENIVSLGSGGRSHTLAGTSVAAPFVTGAIALLWSEFPGASAADIKLALSPHDRRPRKSIVPPILDAWGAYVAMSRN